MSESNRVENKRKLDQVAEDFENNWDPNARNKVEQWLQKVDESQRPELLNSLFAVDVELRQKQNLPVDAAEYRDLGSFAADFAKNLETSKAGEQATVPPVKISPGKTTPMNESTVVYEVSDLPRRVDNYELVKRLGVGGMGEVYLARHHKFRERLYAIKLLKVNLVSDEAMLRFENEIQVAGKLQHPNVIFATDAGSLDGEPYLVMEYVDGHDLQDIVSEKGPLAVADACELVRLAANGLQHAFEKGFTHRDIKPANIMLSAEGEVKVLDMGLARLREQSQSMGLTTRGQFLGTPDYMAPEQWNESSTVGTAADIYSLGCTLFTLLAGRTPYYSEDKSSIVAKMSAHVQDEIPDVREFNSKVPEELSVILRKSMSKQPEDRYATPAEFAKALEPFVNGFDLGKHSSPSMILSESKIPTFAKKLPSEETKWNEKPESSSRPPVLSANLTCGTIATISVTLSLFLTFGVIQWAGVYFNTAAKEMSMDSASKPIEETSIVGRVEFLAYRLSEDLTEEYDEINGATAEGRVVYERERARLEIGFEKPVYFMVLAFTPAEGNDKTQLIWPDDPEKTPEIGEGFLFPVQSPEKLTIKMKYSQQLKLRSKTWLFSDGVGMHSFVVLSSVKPLPSFQSIRDKLLEIPWKFAKPKPYQWEIQNNTAMVDFVRSDNTLALRGFESSDEVDLQPFVDALKAVIPNAQVDGIIFYVEEAYN